jgi:ABC-type lipoprotein release transport system permease subunit
MGAVRLVFGARRRGHWRSWLGLCLLVALVSGLVMAATAAGRRTDQAFPRYLAAHGYDAIVYTVTPRPQLARLPEVAAATPVSLPFYGPPTCTCHSIQVDENDFTVREVPPADLARVAKLVAGRMPDQGAADEALASFTMARDNGVRVGTRIRLPMYAPSQRAAAFASLAGARPPRAKGPVITLTIVGIAAAEVEFPSGQTTAYDLYTTRAFAAASPGTPALQTYYVRLRGGPAASARFESRPSIKGAGVEDLAHPAAAITTSIRPQAVGWWALAGLTALAGLALLAQALARQALAEDGDFPVLATLGLRPRDLAGLGLLRAAVIAVIGAAGGVVVAVALSPIAPLGEARLAEPAPGLDADWPVLGAGALATVVLVLVIGAAVAGRSARARLRAGQDAVSRPSAVVRAAVAAGVPASAVIGLRHALTRTPGTRALPVATALTGAVAAVTALCATAVFGASLTHLTRSPELYGAPFQGYVFSSGPGAAPAAMLAALNQDPAISRVTAATDTAMAVNGVSVRAITTRALRGPTLLSAVQGRLPGDAGEIALGVSTLHRTGARIGSWVAVTVTDPDGTRRTARFRVVGLVAFPGDFSTGGLGTGATLTTAGYLDAACPPGPGQLACQRSVQQAEQSVLLVRAAAGHGTSLTQLDHRYPNNLDRPRVPEALVNFGESANFPLMLGAVLVLCGIAALGYLLIASVARRRPESALLKALGFLRRQTAAVVFWQASAVAVIGVIIGLPLGAAVGQAIWRVFAFDLGMVAVPVVPGWQLVALAAGVLVAANALAVVPAVAAARSRTGLILRTE